MKLNFKHVAIAIAMCFFATADVWANSAIYACGHIRRDREKAIPALKNSGYTTAIIFNVTVEKDGTLTTDYDWGNQRPAEAGGIICKDGKYVFGEYQPHFADDVKSLLQAPTSISRIEFCIGGWGNGSYGNVRNLVNNLGTGEGSILYRNFKALKEAIPEVVAINNDQEQDYDVASVTAFHKMLAAIGYKTTIAPYTQKAFWQQLVANLNADSQICDLVYLQTYGGGAGNNPNDWKVFGNIPMYVGYDNESNNDIAAMSSRFTAWRDNAGAKGGFIWNFNNNNHNLNQWATAINRIFHTEEVADPAVTLYDKSNFGGNAYTLPAGEFSQGEMSLYGVQGKDITSFELKEGYEITLYGGETFDGDSKTWTESSTYVGVAWFKRACSLKIKAADTGVEAVAVAAPRALEVFDICGRRVIEDISTLTPAAYIAQSSLPAGIYIVKADGKACKVVR